MKLTIQRGHITLIPESPAEEAYIEDTLGLSDFEARLRLVARGIEGNARHYSIGRADPQPDDNDAAAPEPTGEREVEWPVCPHCAKRHTVWPSSLSCSELADR